MFPQISACNSTENLLDDTIGPGSSTTNTPALSLTKVNSKARVKTLMERLRLSVVDGGSGSASGSGSTSTSNLAIPRDNPTDVLMVRDVLVILTEGKWTRNNDNKSTAKHRKSSILYTWDKVSESTSLNLLLFGTR